MLGWRHRQDTVTQIEDVRTTLERARDLQRLLAQGLAARQKCQRVEIALQCHAGRDTLGCACRIGGRIDRDAVNAGPRRVAVDECSRQTRGSRSRGVRGCLALSAWTMIRVGSITQTWNCDGGRIPDQLSNSMTASAPASIWADRYATVASTIVAINCPKSAADW